MRYSGNSVMTMPYSRNEYSSHSKRIPYPNEKDANRSYPDGNRSHSSKSHPHSKPSYEEPEKIRIESAVSYNKEDETKNKILFSVFGFDIHLDDLILVGLIVILFLGKSKKNDNDGENDKDKDKGLFGLGDDLILIVALGYLLLDNFL